MTGKLQTALYNVAGLFALGLAAVPALVSPRWREGLGERLGLAGGAGPAARGEECYWIHGASVGEVLAARGLVEGILRRHPGSRLVVSTFTAAGRETARGKFGGRVACTLLPVDWNGVPARVLARVRPSLFVLLETELWPNLLKALAERGCPVVLVNGRISERSFPRYRALRWFFRPFLGVFTLLCVRSETDAERFRLLGARPERIRVTGNIKYAGITDEALPARAEAWKGGEAPGSPGTIVAGSLRGGESETVLGAYLRLRARRAGLRLVLAPRYPERFDRAVLDGLPLTWRCWSAAGEGPAARTDVLLVDTVGDLAALYGLADVAFVGGTLEGGEGHNLLEPAARGVPVLFGPGFRNFQEEGRALLDAGGGFVTGDGAALERRLEALLEDGPERREAGARARQVSLSFAGGLERTMEALEEALQGRGA